MKAPHWIERLDGKGILWSRQRKIAAPAPRSAKAKIASAEKGWAGALDGVWHWRLPDTPNGLRPTQSWHAIGSSPGGDITIAGMDHVTNAALYRIQSRDGELRYLGDARAASEAADNWHLRETAQKFHTRPLWVDGRVYVATMDRSTLDRSYLRCRGFHWYVYDEYTARFLDLSAAEPGGVGAKHGSLVTLAYDPLHRVIYGAGVPTGDIFRYDLSTGRTTKLGRPAAYDRPFVYAGRIMWVDSRGRLYFTAGNPRYSPHRQSPSIYGHVFYYDPATGFGEKAEWKLQAPRALEAGQRMRGGQTWFFTDDQGEIYRFDESGLAWSHLGRADVPTAPASVWLFQVSPGGDKAYIVTSDWASGPSFLYAFDFATRQTRRLCNLAELSPDLAALTVHTGYDSWDDEGRFYFASFAADIADNLLVTRIDPGRVMAALKL